MTSVSKTNNLPLVSKQTKVTTLSNLQQQVRAALNEAINHLDAQNKKSASSISITKVAEYNYQKDKSFILIHFGYRANKLLLTSVYKKLVTQLEKRLKKTVLLLSTRKIQSRWIKQNKTQTRPNSRTLSAVYSAILDELLLPGVIIGSRTRVRLDGSSFTRITLDKSEQHFVEDRVECIRFAYKTLAHRDIQIDFQKQSTYFTLKKGEKK